jgi:YidC/Oxa1 family membrane protein insertase
MQLFNSLVDGLGSILFFFHDLLARAVRVELVGLVDRAAHVTVRVFLLPLAVKQTNSMRGMQGLQPEIKKIQAKYKTDRDMMKKNPEKYRERRQKQQEEMMALYKEHGVNPAAGACRCCCRCRSSSPCSGSCRTPTASLSSGGAPFYLVGDLSQVASGDGHRRVAPRRAHGGIYVLLPEADDGEQPQRAQNPQQKILLYVMPMMLLVFAFQMPIGVLLYWVTTNLWTIAQQFVMFRNIEPPSGAKTAKA